MDKFQSTPNLEKSEWYEVRMHEVQQPTQGIMPGGCYQTPYVEIVLHTSEFQLNPVQPSIGVDAVYRIQSGEKSFDVKAGETTIISKIDENGEVQKLYLVGPTGSLVNFQENLQNLDQFMQIPPKEIMSKRPLHSTGCIVTGEHIDTASLTPKKK